MNSHLNLLPWQFRCRMLVRQRLRQWLFAGGVLFVFSATILISKWQTVTAENLVLQDAERRVSTTRALDESNRVLRRRTAALNQRLAKQGHLKSEQLGFHILATLSQSASKCEGRIQIQKLAFKQQEVPIAATGSAGEAAAAAPKTAEVRTLVLNGVAADNLAIAQFVSALRDSQAFRGIDLKSSRGQSDADAGSQMYQLECSF